MNDFSELESQIKNILDSLKDSIQQNTIDTLLSLIMLEIEKFDNCCSMANEHIDEEFKVLKSEFDKLVIIKSNYENILNSYGILSEHYKMLK